MLSTHACPLGALRCSCPRILLPCTAQASVLPHSQAGAKQAVESASNCPEGLSYQALTADAKRAYATRQVLSMQLQAPASAV